MVLFYAVRYWLSNAGSYLEDCCGWKFERLKFGPSCRNNIYRILSVRFCVIHLLEYLTLKSLN